MLAGDIQADEESVCRQKERRHLQHDEGFQQESGSDDLINGQRCPVQCAASTCVCARPWSKVAANLRHFSAQLSVADPRNLRLSREQLLEHVDIKISYTSLHTPHSVILYGIVARKAQEQHHHMGPLHSRPNRQWKYLTGYVLSTCMRTDDNTLS